MAKDKLLRKFMIEHFPFTELRKAGFFTPEMKGDYEAQAKRVCTWFGYDTVYEYGSKEIRCHVTFSGDRPLSINNNGELEPEPFITVIPSIYE